MNTGEHCVKLFIAQFIVPQMNTSDFMWNFEGYTKVAEFKL